MNDKFQGTMKFEFPKERNSQIKDVVLSVYESLKSKGYNPIDQIIGYILSGDPSYITSYNNAREMMREIERDELLEELIKSYLENK